MDGAREAGREQAQMRTLAAAVRFSAWAALPQDAQRLDEGALLVAEIGRPGLDHGPVISQLDALAAEVWEALGPDTRLLRPEQTRRRRAVLRVLETLHEVLIVRHDLHGADDDYTNPRNSFLDQALSRRTGLPIVLSVILIEVARRLGVTLEGIGLPAHFMARWPLPPGEGGPIYVDAYHHRLVMEESEMRQFILSLVTAPPHVAFDPAWTRALDTRQVVTRMLLNLKGAYFQRGETTKLLEVVDRLTALRPDLPEELRDRGLLRLALGEPLLAAADIAAYLQRAPEAPERRRLQRRIESDLEVRAKLN
jgi:regulator of sirC expression with transglutaminase-like and TPR domain